MSFSPDNYGPVFAEFFAIDRNRALDAGVPNQSDYSRLQSLTIAEAFAHTHVTDTDQARCCLSAIWLLYDFLDESHTISQGIATAEGSFWHGIMHRREGDFSNAKYWFRKVGDHPVYASINSEWDPYDFVDQCQVALRSDDTTQCRQLQQREWEALFDHCYQGATAQ